MQLLRRKSPDSAVASPDVPELDDDTLLSRDAQDQIQAKRSQQELAAARANTNWWRIVAAMCAGYSILATFGWKHADDRYMDDVRVAWVKLQPSGASQVEYFDNGARKDRFFEATVNSSLVNYVERSTRKIRESIADDYAYAVLFLDDQRAQDFLSPTGFNASKKAADFERCQACDRVTVSVQHIDHETVNTPDKDNDETATYESTVYYELTTRPSNGTPTTAKKIKKILWSLRSVEQIPKDLQLLRGNPLAIQIHDERDLDDPSSAGLH